ncbi:bifunctional DNA primase/polymerase [Streptomyces ortus]|uniref:Bifunctional DNA primase/polymerase n=1 Tax=Streptomyces ortus TaxID=2867268 RepID=A0ABT3V131_9ACTN|nr:bifunctional DNA primase/polymerase [Streptomyces ortus]MCX4232003.1 bifunctional DNA primase/polymerase [Streptomyces ortus]
MTSTAVTRRTECEQCAGPLPLMARADAQYCGATCRKRASRSRIAARQARVSAERQARIPAELTSRPRWVRHKDKVPLRVDGRFASVKDPSSWSDYAAATASRAGDGVGFVLTAGDGIVVIDLDHAVEDGQILPWAQTIADQLPPTYMERGRSGTGLHLWFRGAVEHGRRIRRGELAVEVYSDRRYMIVGDRVPGTPLSLAELPDAAGLIASL